MKTGTIKRIVILLIIAGLVIGLQLSGLGRQLTLENLQAHASQLRDFSDRHYFKSVAAFILTYIVVTGFSLPGALILTLAGGFLYKTLLAAIYVNVGATTGATLAFLAARYIAGDWIQFKYADKLVKFNRELDRNGSNYLLILRLVPVFPFFLINIFAGLTRVPLKTFIWTTSLGILPGSLIYAYAGEQLGMISNVRDIFTTRILIAFLLLALLAFLPILLRKLKKSKF
ncbi:MAG: hypothetical protein A2Y07_06745 [Planctomycetes bacterium GWF2_50_10]|nr:MAG: hypothetical protein A2Y07_06745 [Planctomycetes bacterium GWF2_50_10]